MIILLTSIDGKINYMCEADSAEDAFHILAKSVGYEDWSAFSTGTGYTARDVKAQRIQDNRKMMSTDTSTFSGDYIKKQQRSAIQSAYRFILGQRG